LMFILVASKGDPILFLELLVHIIYVLIHAHCLNVYIYVCYPIKFSVCKRNMEE